MSVIRKFFAFCPGAAIGIYIAIYLVIAGNDQKGFGRAVILVERPMLVAAEYLFGKMGIGLYMVLHLGFFALVGGLLSLGIAILLSKVTGDD